MCESRAGIGNCISRVLSIYSISFCYQYRNSSNFDRRLPKTVYARLTLLTLMPILNFDYSGYLQIFIMFIVWIEVQRRQVKKRLDKN